MATSLVVNGTSYLYPDTGDQSWGTVASAWAAAVTGGMLQKAGGSFVLTADANFGSNFGLLSKYFTSQTSNAAASGIVRLANTESVAWRNAANNADILLAVNASNQLTFAGVEVLSAGSLVPVSAGGTGISSGTSGGIPYFASTSTMASSGLLAQYGVVLGGGSAASPVTLTPNASTALPLVSGGASANPSWAALTVAGGGTSLTSGTSGGVPYFSSTSAMASSGLLTVSQLVLGGGAGSAPTSLAAGTQYQSLTMGATVPGYSAVNLAQGAAVTGVLPNANTTAASANTASTIVARDGSGNFTAGTITAALTGTASGNTTYTANQYGVVLSGSANAMVVLAPDASTAKVLVSGGASANPTWTTLTNTNLSGSAAISNANLAAMNANTVKANVTGGSATPTDVALVSAATASAVMIRDANANVQANNFNANAVTIATAAGTTTLTVASNRLQQFTGSTTQTVVMPDATTLTVGQAFTIANRSTGTVTVNKNGGALLQSMSAGSQCTFTVISIGTSAGTWDNAISFTSGSGSGSVTSVTFTGDGTVLSSTPSSAVTTSGTVTASLNTQNKNKFLAGPTTGADAAPTFRVLATADFVAPTVQTFTSSTGTYTTPTSPRGPVYIRVRLVGGGGGGAGGGTTSATNGGTGGNTTFGTTLLAGNGGSGGQTAANGSNQALGGTASLGSGPIGFAAEGNDASGASNFNIAGYSTGGTGAASPFCGAGAGGSNTTGTAATANSGSGGGGGGTTSTGSGTGGGGAAGGYVDAIIAAPSATYSYAVGAAGTLGAAGTGGYAGAAGGSGYIIVEEYYQ